ncbi:solute carrier family 22 member 7-like [Acipenser oxyrinchus oxyrinchus]|uniref:Solute carrier family 22 member 6 n=1 Tax=Acipenser oxyrinchus oxyrinchus TaxID=40147 RepID=A0AAD8LLW4_ACIOX|nr:solute carrier family 22 member 7-like [Acipenser oxyrinchus oxyrinchus]
MKFENILADIGGFGRFQIFIFVILCFPRMTLPWHFLLHNFISAVPTHHCAISDPDNGDIFGNLTAHQKLVVSIPMELSGTFSTCKMFSEPQFQLLSNSSMEAGNAAATVECQYGWVYDTSIFSSTVATEWDMVCNKKGLNQASATFFFIGVMIGAIVFGGLSDKLGRKPMLLASFTVSIVFGLAATFSVSYVMFAIMRSLTGFGLTGISIISICLTIEWVDIEHRTFIGVFGSMVWSTGNMMLALIAYLIRDWRWLLLTVTSPLVICCIVWWWIPESARWLLANGKVHEAHTYLSKCAKMNNRKDASSKITPEMLSRIVTVEGKNKNYTYLDLVRTPKMRRLAICTGIIWFGVAHTYYGISLNITGFGLNMYLTQFIYGAIELPAKLLVYYMLNRIGRRQSQAWSLLLTGVCLGINLFLPSSMVLVRSVIAILGKGLSEASFTILYLYTAELYPTVVRQNGIGYNSFVARLGVSAAPLIMLLEDIWKLLPQTIFCSVAILAGFTAFFLPETQNLRLPETIEDVEQTRKRTNAISAQERTDISLKPLNCDLKENVS